MKLLNKEYTIKKKMYNIILDSIIGGIIISILLYYLLNNCNDELIQIFRNIQNGDVSAKTVTLITTPIVIIISLIINIVSALFSNNSSK